MKIYILIVILFIAAPSFADREVIGEWKHEIKVDPMKDTKSCGITTTSILQPTPFILYLPGSISIGAIGKLYPGRNVIVRVDKNSAVEQKKYLLGDNANQVIRQIKDGGNQMLMEVIEWPSGAPYIMTINLEGLKEHLNACDKAVNGE